jgi:hypothetical protein
MKERARGEWLLAMSTLRVCAVAQQKPQTSVVSAARSLHGLNFHTTQPKVQAG